MYTFKDWARDKFGDPEYFGKEYNGDISCAYVELDSLEGAPLIVNGHFNCSGNDLVNLKGAPRTVNGIFECSNSDVLESLEGSPKVCRIFNIKKCPILTSIKGCAEQTQLIDFSYSAIESLEGCGSTRTLFLKYTNIKNLIGIPNVNSIDASNSKLESLEGCPHILDSLFVYGTKLSSLEYSPKTIKKTFEISNTNITTFEGGPQKVGTLFANNLSIKNLKDFPKELKGASISTNELPLEILVVDAILHGYIKKIEVIKGIQSIREFIPKFKNFIELKGKDKKEEYCFDISNDFGYQYIPNDLKKVLLTEESFVKI